MTPAHPDILTIENKTQEKFLRKKTADFDFSKFSQKEVDALVSRMRNIMRAADGIGLAANQIGLDLNMFVGELRDAEGGVKFFAVFNPTLEQGSSRTAIMEEGCLSVPGVFGEVPRMEQVTLRGLDKLGKPIRIKARGLLARIFQHEVGHLQGGLFIDKAKSLHTYEPIQDGKNRK